MSKVLIKRVSKVLLCFLIMLSGLSITTNAEAAQAPLAIKLDGVPVISDVSPYIDASSRTMVPVRFVSEALGARVEWEQATRTVKIIKGSDNLLLRIDSDELNVNGAVTKMDTTAVVKSGRTFVPVRFIAEALGLTVGWDGATNTVLLSTGKQFSPDYDDIVYKDNVANLYESSPAVLTYSNNGGTVIVSSNILKTSPKRGDIIILPPDLSFPGGRAIKVTSAEIVGDNTRMQVEEPAFEEVFENCDFSTTFKPDSKEIVDLYNARMAAGIGMEEFGFSAASDKSSVNNIVAMARPSGNDIVALSDSLPTSSKPSFTLQYETDDTITLAVSIPVAKSEGYGTAAAINGSINFAFEDIAVEYSGFRSLTKWNSVDVVIPVTMVSDISLNGSLSEELIMPLGPPIGLPTPVPWVYLEVIPYLTVGVGGEVEIGIMQTSKLTYGAECSPIGGISPVVRVRELSFPEPKQLKFVGSGKAVMQMATGVKIVGLDTVIVTPELGLGISGETEPAVCKNLHISAYMLLNVEAKLGKNGLLRGVLNFYDKNNATQYAYYFDVDAVKLIRGECPHSTQIPSVTALTADEVLKKLEYGNYAAWIDKAYYEGPINDDALSPLRAIFSEGRLTVGRGFAEPSAFNMTLTAKTLPDGKTEINYAFPNNGNATYKDGRIIVEPTSGEITEIKYVLGAKEHTLAKFTGYVARYTAERSGNGVRLAWTCPGDGNTMEYNVYRSEKKGERGVLIKSGLFPSQGQIIDTDVKAGSTYYYSIYFTSAGEEQRTPISFGNESQIAVDY